MKNPLSANATKAVPAFATVLLIGWHGAASAAGLAPLAAFLTFLSGAAQTIGIIVFVVVCIAVALASEAFHHGMGKLVVSVVFVAIACTAVAFGAQLGLGAAAGAMLPTVGFAWIH